MALRAGLAVVAGRTERLKVLDIERCTALVYGTDMVHDTGRSVATLRKAAFA